MPVQYVLQATNIDKLREFIPPFMEKVEQSSVFRMSDVNLKFTKPEIRIHLDRDKAALLGVNTRDIAQTLQYALSGQRMGYFYMNGKQYQILGEINRQQRNTPLDLRSIYIKNARGEMIQMDNLVKLEEAVAPRNCIVTTVSVRPLYLLHWHRVIRWRRLDEMDRISQEVLDETFRTALSGESKEFKESSSSLIFAFGLAIVLIFLVLAAQFESFKDPLIIMLTVPLAVGVR